MYNSYSSEAKNHAICRKDLDFIFNGNFISHGYEEISDIKFMKINGYTNFWDVDDTISVNSIIGSILNSCVRHGIPFAYVIIGDKKGINIYVGTMKILLDSVQASYKASFPGIDIEIVNDNPLRSCPKEYGGMFTGIPTDKMNSEKKNFQIENICRGMQGNEFTYVVLASGISNIAVTLGHEKILDEMSNVFSQINQTVTGGAQGNLSAQKQDFHSKNYFDNLEKLESMLKKGASRGMWRVNGYFAANDILSSKKLGNIIKASYSGDESIPEPFRVIEYNYIRDVIPNTYMMADLVENFDIHPVGKWSKQGINKPITLFIYKYQTILNSDQLSVMCQLPTKEFSGFYIDQHVEFDVSNRTSKKLIEPVPLGNICIAGRHDRFDSDNGYFIEKNDFTRHALIIGITGGGKTNTSKSILNTIWVDKKIPFLVIESAKREYWELRNLKGFEDLIVFTLGAEDLRNSIKYRINPFETNPDISLQTHIDYLLSTFKAAFELYPPMPYILEKAVYEIYSDRGWDIVENINRLGLTEYPTLTDLYNKISVVVDDMGYHQEIQSNVKAALQARVYSLMIGGKGAMMNTSKSIPIKELLSRPVILELEDLGDDETKSFVIGILLVQLYEYRKSQMTKGSKDLTHILMVEEAHRLLKNVSEGGEGGNTKSKSVEFFCNLLAEIRTYGQGILIADQIPTKLAPDTIKNTNLKIVHRTVALEDRETIGKSMNMNEEQIEYLSSLRRGYAAVYSEGDNRPKCVKFPLIKSFYDKNRREVIAEVREKLKSMANGYDQVINKHIGCTYCEKRCSYYQKVSTFIDNNIDIEKVLQKWIAKDFSASSFSAFINSNLLSSLNIEDKFETICILGYIISKEVDLNDGQKQKYISNFLKHIVKNNI